MTNHFIIWKFTAQIVNYTIINDFQVHSERGKFSNIFWPLENLNAKKPLSSHRIYLSHKIFMIDLFNTKYFANQILIANTKMRWSPSIYNTRTFVNFLNLQRKKWKAGVKKEDMETHNVELTISNLYLLAYIYKISIQHGFIKSKLLHSKSHQNNKGSFTYDVHQKMGFLEPPSPPCHTILMQKNFFNLKCHKISDPPSPLNHGHHKWMTPNEKLVLMRHESIFCYFYLKKPWNSKMSLT